MQNSLLSFLGVAALLVMAPGVDFALVLKNSLVARRQGVATALGVVNGMLLHTLLAVVGLTAILTYDLAVLLLYAVSGGFLVYLGIRGLVSVIRTFRRSRESAAQEEVGSEEPNTLGKGRTVAAFRSGFLVNALNPKAPVLFLSIMPQFIPSGASHVSYTLLLGTVVIACGLLWFPMVAVTAHRLGPLLTRPKVRVAVEGATAVVILSLGVLQWAALFS
ncbi:LysE family translocator [Streptomyces noursei]|uniref:LysE family translocator n=1 Tax=Streptomyces noursei TaxID=1971 RepID=UPI0016791935|nr:LysE family translocator [Streptomyces noursei]MCZ1016391.1 LysE family translocator [Streptomyces noursei]GGX00030.1 lysine transporter LysE [Streptomyces noursei]